MRGANRLTTPWVSALRDTGVRTISRAVRLRTGGSGTCRVEFDPQAPVPYNHPRIRSGFRESHARRSIRRSFQAVTSLG